VTDLDSLRKALHEAGTVAYGGNIAETTPEQKRKAASLAIDAIAVYLRGIGVETELLRPLTEGVLGAIADADEGVRNPLFKLPKRGDGRPPVGHLSEAVMGHGAAAVYLLIRGGEKEEAALRKVATKLGIGWKQLKNYRAIIRQKGRTANSVYDTCIGQADPRDRIECQEAAEKLLSILGPKTA
jgi:hypothetical protein